MFRWPRECHNESHRCRPFYDEKEKTYFRMRTGLALFVRRLALEMHQTLARLVDRKFRLLARSHRKVTNSVAQTLVAIQMHLPVFRTRAAAEFAADQTDWPRIVLALRTC